MPLGKLPVFGKSWKRHNTHTTCTVCTLVYSRYEQKIDGGLMMSWRLQLKDIFDSIDFLDSAVSWAIPCLGWYHRSTATMRAYTSPFVSALSVNELANARSKKS